VIAKWMKYLEGDRALWFLLLALGLFSFLPVYSASSNLAYSYSGGNTIKFLVKHAFHLGFGFVLMYSVHKVNPKYYRNLPMILLPITLLLLAITLAIGTTIGEANASRWIRVPFIGVSFQTSELAKFCLLMFVARYLTQNQETLSDFKKTFINLVIPIGLICMLILPANFSTTALIFALCLGLMFIGKYPIKHIGILLGIGVAGSVYLFLRYWLSPTLATGWIHGKHASRIFLQDRPSRIIK
jgi:cell division protein FtsW